MGVWACRLWWSNWYSFIFAQSRNCPFGRSLWSLNVMHMCLHLPFPHNQWPQSFILVTSNFYLFCFLSLIWLIMYCCPKQYIVGTHKSLIFMPQIPYKLLLLCFILSEWCCSFTVQFLLPKNLFTLNLSKQGSSLFSHLSYIHLIVYTI